MIIVDLLLPLIMAAVLSYGGSAYRFGLPSPIPSRHDRALVRIAKLEIALGISQPAPQKWTLAAERYASNFVQIQQAYKMPPLPPRSGGIPGRNEIPPNSRPGQQDLA